jgi:purine nucleoside phosphorylase
LLQHSVPFELPQPIAEPAPREALESAAQTLRTFFELSGKDDLVGVLLSKHHNRFLDRLQQVKKFPLKNLPHFGGILERFSSELFVGTSESAGKVIGVSEGNLVGFACEDANYLANLFHVLGVRKFLCTFSAGSAHGSKVGDVMFMGDFIEFSTIHSVVFAPNHLTQLLPARPLADHLDSHWTALGLSPAVYGAFPGPTFPTIAELHSMPRYCNSAGISST